MLLQVSDKEVTFRGHRRRQGSAGSSGIHPPLRASLRFAVSARLLVRGGGRCHGSWLGCWSMSGLRSGVTVALSRAGLVLALTAVLVVGSVSPVGALAGYGDVGGGTWYTDAVQWSVDNGIADISGFCFGPETPVSRGETAVWIYNMENQPDAGEQSSVH